MSGAYIEMNGTMQFLIVDPVVPNVEAMKLNLKKMGYKNFSVKPDAFEAMNHIRTQKVEFILCRLNLKDVSGSDFMEELKNDLTIPRIPFMMFSEHMDEGDLALLSEIGVDAHLTIPFVTKDLATKVMATWSRYIDPKNPEFHYEAARRLFLAGKTQEAADAFAKIASAGKLVSRALIAHGRAIAKLGRLEDSLQIAQKVRKDYPKFVHGHQFAGELLVQQKKDVEALECFFTAIALSPKNPYRYQMITEILMRMERFKESEMVLGKAIESGVDLPFIAENMAQALIKQDKKEDALSWYQKLVDRDPKNSAYHNNIAICYKKLNNLPKALEHYQRAADVAPKDARVRYNLALALLDSDKKQAGINTLRETLGLDKNHEKAKFKLMELTDAKAWAIETAKRKAAEEQAKKLEEAKKAKAEAEAKARAEKAQKEADELAAAGISAAPVEVEDESAAEVSPDARPTLSKEDEERLAALIEKLIKLQTSKKAVGVKPLEISDDVKAKIEQLSGSTLHYYYGIAAQNIRKQLFKLMGEWFASLMVISEELAVDIGDIIQTVLQEQKIDVGAAPSTDVAAAERAKSLIEIATKASATDDRLKNELMPIIMDLQFQDYLRQSLEALKKTFKISYAQRDRLTATELMVKCLVTVEDKAALKELMMPGVGAPASAKKSEKNPATKTVTEPAKPSEDASSGDSLFFDEPTVNEPAVDMPGPAEDAGSGDVLLF